MTDTLVSRPDLRQLPDDEFRTAFRAFLTEKHPGRSAGCTVTAA